MHRKIIKFYAISDKGTPVSKANRNKVKNEFLETIYEEILKFNDDEHEEVEHIDINNFYNFLINYKVKIP